MTQEDAVRAARTVLEVGATDEVAAIRSAFRRRSMETHPDRGGHVDDFEEVKAAYELLLRHLSEPDVDWFVDRDDDDVDVRVVDEQSRPRRKKFEDMFLEALRREHGE